MDVKTIPGKCISSLVQQGLDIIQKELKTEITWSRINDLIVHEKFFETVNYVYQK